MGRSAPPKINTTAKRFLGANQKSLGHSQLATVKYGIRITKVAY